MKRLELFLAMYFNKMESTLNKKDSHREGGIDWRETDSGLELPG